jgi:16S rRNA (uracil1498-N3)-methyltransferase
MTTPFTYFYLDSRSISGEHVEFSEEESRHMKKVCRVSEGDVVHATDGCGHVYRVTVHSAAKRTLVGRIDEQTHVPIGGQSCHLAFPITGEQKMDWVIEKCTELGISRFLVFSCERSIGSGAGSRKRDRHMRIACAAMKQSMRAYLPEFEYLDGIGALIEKFGVYQNVLLGHLGDSSRNLTEVAVKLSDAACESMNALVVVGPESGFTQPESSMLTAAGALPVVFGRHRLRMETAAVVLSAAVIQCLPGI